MRAKSKLGYKSATLRIVSMMFTSVTLRVCYVEIVGC